MAKVVLRRQALELRKLGKSYGQIRNELGISKSTLSEWLRHYPLTKEQIRQLNYSNESRIEKFRQTMLVKRDRRTRGYYEEAKKEIMPLSKKELLIAGLFLYWGEGGKSMRSLVSISNTDPAVLKFSLYWMNRALGVSKEKIRILLHLYEDMNREEAIEYWSKTLNMPKSQFVKPYIKKSKRADIDYKGFGHGTCMLRVCDTVIQEKILMSIKAMADCSDEYIRRF